MEENVLPQMEGIPVTHKCYKDLLAGFVEFYMENKDNAHIVVHMGLPVEARLFLDAHQLGFIGDWDAPFPLIDASAFPKIGTSVDNYNAGNGVVVDANMFTGGTHNPLYDSYATAENVSYYKKPDIDECICDYIIAKYPFFDEDSDNYDETTEDLYEELCYLIEDNYPLDVYKNNYFYTLVAENIKRTLEKMLEESELASKTEEIHPLKLIHDNNLVINFGVNYKID